MVGPWQLSPATKPPESVSTDILSPLPKSKCGYFFILVISERFSKLTQIVPIRPIKEYDVAVAFTDHWVFKYRSNETLLTYIGPHLTVRFIIRVCKILGAMKSITKMYHPQCNGKVERLNRSLEAMFRCYLDDNPTEWCCYTPALSSAYAMALHRSS